MKLRIFLVLLILAAQIAGIFCVSFSREREWQNTPTFRLECASYDPRDFLRGHYLLLRFKIENKIPISKFDAPAQKLVESLAGNNVGSYVRLPRTQKFRAILTPNTETGFWEIERVTTEDPKIDFNANPQAGKIALEADSFYVPLGDAVNIPAQSTTQTAQSPKDFFTAGSPFEINIQLFFPLLNLRFYLPEEKAKEFDEKFRGNTQHVISAELFIRNDGSAVPKRIFIDGEEY